MKKLFLLPLALGSVLLSSCQDEDFGYESSKIAYEKTMSQMLGEVAPDQTWVNAEQGYVTISEECQNVKVFDGLTGKVIANYNNLRPGSKVYYNATIGYNPTISNGTVAMEVKNGQNVSFMAAGGSVEPQIEVGDDRLVVKANFIQKDMFRTGIKDRTSNFEFVATGSTNDLISFDVYPLYWNTTDQLTVGLYYYDPLTNEVKICSTPLYQNRQKNLESGIMQSYHPIVGSSWSPTQNDIDEYWENTGDYIDSRYYYDTDGSRHDVQAYRIKRINVTVPANLVFGFYVKSNDGPIYYANPALNTKCGKNDECEGGIHADSYSASTGYQTNAFGYDANEKLYYLALSADHHDNRYIRFGGTDKNPIGQFSRNIYLAIANVRTINYDAQSYTLCFEDLGATGIKDMDFNDCVLKLNCVNGLNQATVSLLAAGGILPINVTYNGNPVWEKEIHAALGTDLVPVNANKHNAGETTDVVNVADKDLPTAEISLPTEANWTIQHVVSLFNLSVKRADGTYNKVSIPTNPGQYPMGFAVAGDFKWPGEQQNIIGTYPDFATWAANSGLSYWYPWTVTE